MRYLVILSFCLLALAGCRLERSYATPEDALLQWPGHITEANRDSLELLAEQEVPGGVVLLYRYDDPQNAGTPCIATTFLSREDNDRWRAQSSGRLGCEGAFRDPSEIFIGVTGGGNVRGLSTVFGLGPGAASVQVAWEDGYMITAPVRDGHVLVSRGETIGVERVRLLNEEGDIIYENDRR